MRWVVVPSSESACCHYSSEGAVGALQLIRPRGVNTGRLFELFWFPVRGVTE